jgi:radical SAM-linked protein
MVRIRIQYSKQNALRFTGNLDMQRVWERSFRRADIPLAHTQGFHPQPRIQQAAPLPLGFISGAELADFWLEDNVLPINLLAALNNSMPDGLEILEIHEVEMKQRSLPPQVQSAIYQAHPLEPLPSDLRSSILLLLSQQTIQSL